MTQETPQSASRLQRTLAFIIGGLVLASLLAIAAVIAGTAFGVGSNNGFSHGVWPTILVLPLIALPIGFILMIVLLIVSGTRRSRANREAQR
ncbi:MAG: hypothetical protein QOD05_12 [Microbacteriaceae bacterium]|nr:hypothetical protein [Leifsonia sp.]MDQ1579237.1 hypothetical protein [Microbacteriaceae bacterium]MDQ1588511.1 hypothetical protein [Microbacteriaceae bacterium]HEV7565079.1 hypothetical protein [Microbacteriaceae bacterium]